MLSYKQYLISSLSKYIFYIFKKKRKYNLNIKNKKLSYFYLYVNKTYLNSILSFLYLDMNSQYKLFIDLVCSDFLNKQSRFYLNYNLISTLYHSRVFVNLWSTELDRIPSITLLFTCSAWFEREVWDMYGIHFDNNYDLRRILTDYGFQGHPLRKDFPLTGFVELYYNERLNTIIYQPTSLIQSYRYFDTNSPWEWISTN